MSADSVMIAMKNKESRLRKKNGFTLIEAVIVLAIMAILMTVAIPSISTYIENGSHEKRMTIARTLFLGAQSKLTELSITKTLKSEMTGSYYTRSGNEYEENNIALSGPTNVAQKLLNKFPATDAGNESYIHYISKPMGMMDETNPVVKLLSPVIDDTSVLENAILIEYNVKTGNVLSVFYSDILKSGEELGYLNSTNDDVKDIIGERPYSDSASRKRKQGYYGVGETGAVSARLYAAVNIYDSYEWALPNFDPNQDRRVQDSTPNVLYAEILIPKADMKVSYNLQVKLTANGAMTTCDLEKNINLNNVTAVSLEQALSSFTMGGGAVNTALIYKYDANIDSRYSRFIWVLDYVGGDMGVAANTGGSRHSIGVKYYKGAFEHNMGSQRVTKIHAGISPSSASTDIQSVMSNTTAHPYFAVETANSGDNAEYGIYTARHLFNVRYLPSAKFTQRRNIDFDVAEERVTNFLPIGYTQTYVPGTGYDAGFTAPSNTEGAFTGQYSGAGYVIKNFKQNLSGTGCSDAGLFAVVARANDKGAKTYPELFGITLENPSIVGVDRTGGIVSTMDGFGSNLCVRYTDKNTGKISGAASDTGGIAARMLDNGMLADSVFISPNAMTHITSSAPTLTGGIVGRVNYSAKLKRILFLAAAPRNGENIYPIAANHNNAAGFSEKLFFLSGGVSEDTRPKATAFPSGTKEYNVGKLVNTTGLPKSTAELNTMLTEFNKGWKLMSGITNPLDTADTVYPYPYALYLEAVLPKHPDWPVVGTEETPANIGGVDYYELYNDDKFGFASNQTLEKNDSLKRVKHDGYALRIPFNDSAEGLKVLLGTKEFKITCTGTEDSPSFLIMENGRSYDWVISKAEKNGEGIMMYRVYIPNSFSEGLSPNGEDVTLKMFAGDGADPFVDTSFNPNLAPAKEGYIRSPRHLDNLDKFLNGSYTQQLKLDFSSYYKELSPDFKPVAASKLAITNNSVVFGKFTGKYDGVGKEITGIINRTYGQGRFGLFSELEGDAEITNVLVTKSEMIYNGGFVGTIAATLSDNAKITGCTVNSVKMNGGYMATGGGTLFVGGIAGQMSGSAEVSECRVYGDVRLDSALGPIGGIVGDLQGGTISKCSVNKAVIESKAANVAYAGGIVGDMTSMDSKVVNCSTGSLTVIGNTASGGIAGGNHGGYITYCYVGMGDTGSGSINYIKGFGDTGGIAGEMVNGEIRYCYTDYTMVGEESGSTISLSAGGIVGRLNTGAVTDVFYNYASIANQSGGFSQTLFAKDGYKGGLIGIGRGAELNNGYTTAYFANKAYAIIGNSSGMTIKADTLFYLSTTNYNQSGTTGVGTPRNLSQMQEDSLVTILSDGWRKGSGAGTSGTTRYPYPRFIGITMPEPIKWPRPAP